MDLTGKVVLIVRGETPLGAGIFSAFAAAGADPVVGAGVASPEEAAALVARCAALRNRVDAAVILPAPFGEAPFLETSENDWRQALQANVAGSLYAAQAVARHMVAQGRGGRIVFVSSVASELAFHATTLMGTVLAAQNTIAQVAAVELGPYGITVNTVAPGWSEGGAGAAFAAPYALDEQAHKAVAANVPLGRLAAPEEIGRACVFLASDAASYISGAYLKVDGGYAITKGEGGTPYPGRPPWPNYNAGYDPASANY
jgi:NAD(P)-dependent dehydrogenase (short-subunit alcohol dehydrogenase family)